MTTQQEIITGLDIGTTKVCVVIGKRSKDGMEIIGAGQSPSYGVKQGMVVNMEKTAAAIRTAITEAELVAGCKVQNIIVGIADKLVRSQNSHGMVRVESGVVSEHDVHQVIESARTIPLSPNREILHVIPQEFIISGLRGIKQPIGMSGSRLEVKAHIITVASTSIRNITKACTQAGLQTSAIVLQSVASAEAALMPEERDLGVVLIDVGGGTTDVAVICNGTVWHTAEIPFAGNHLTEDLAANMHISKNEAELVKCVYGCCFKAMVENKEPVEIAASGAKPKRFIQRHSIAIILQARVEELFTLIAKELRRFNHNRNLVAGVVITGGSSQLPGLVDLAEQVLNMQARIGHPLISRGLVDKVSSPAYSSGVGLVLYGARTESETKRMKSEADDTIVRRAIQIVQNVWRKLRFP